MGGFLRGSMALCILAGCSGGAPPASEPTAKTAAVSPAVMEAVRNATNRSQVQVETVTLPNGERLKRAFLGTGRQHVVVGRRNADGSVSASCVNTPSEAEAFLGESNGARAAQ